MGKRRYIVALDQGTTSSRCILFDNEGKIVALEQKEFKQIYPHPGWVEHDPMEIYSSIYSVMTEVIARSGIKPYHIAGIGITNQRETTIVWDKNTGKPIYNAIVWQCRRSANIIEQAKADGLTQYVKDNTGLVIDAYYSASKIKWILDHVEGAKEKAKNGDLLFGTVDTWLIWKLTGGKVHATDYSNASRTMLFNLKTLTWDEKLCSYFGVEPSMLPEVKYSSDDYGVVSLFGYDIPLAGVAGDQQSALFGQCGFEKGDIKNTYGTGCFLLMNIGDKFKKSKSGLVTSLGACISHQVNYVLEGSVFVGGAIVQWLRDEMRFIVDAADSEYFATKVKDNGGVYIVPAFTGLGAPYWDMYARGTIFGLTRGSSRNHIVRASLEAIAYQTYDVIKAMEKDTGIKINSLKVDGGASRNNFLMQFQSDILSSTIVRPVNKETTALGACFLAGLQVGIWKDLDEIRAIYQKEREFKPSLKSKAKDEYIKKWHKAISMCKGWEDQ